MSLYVLRVLLSCGLSWWCSISDYIPGHDLYEYANDEGIGIESLVFTWRQKTIPEYDGTRAPFLSIYLLLTVFTVPVILLACSSAIVGLAGPLFRVAMITV